MKVKVKLLGHLPYYLKEKTEVLTVELPPDSNLGELFKALKACGVPLVDVELVSRGGCRLDQSAALNEGDFLEVLPIASGG
ncbi:MAG: hypothetical protein V2A78_01640 [bacterium]